MKKTIIAPMLLAAGLWMLLPSCGSNTENDAALQAPQTNQAEIPAGVNEKDDDEAGEKEGEAAQNSSGDAGAVTVQNLRTAFTGETTASAKYADYAKKAQEEGYTEIALLFKAASMSEKIHAANHKSVLEELGEKAPEVSPKFTVKTTKENLEDAIAGESYEITTMYPEFLSVAGQAGSQLALISLNYAYKTEQKHKPLYEKALAALQGNQVNTLPTQYFVCPTCGNTYDGTAPKRCGISMTGGERFVKVNSL